MAKTKKPTFLVDLDKLFGTGGKLQATKHTYLIDMYDLDKWDTDVLISFAQHLLEEVQDRGTPKARAAKGWNMSTKAKRARIDLAFGNISEKQFMEFTYALIRGMQRGLGKDQGTELALRGLNKIYDVLTPNSPKRPH